MLKTIAICVAAASVVTASALQTFLTVESTDARVANIQCREFYIDGTIRHAQAIGHAVEDIHAHRVTREEYYREVSKAYAIYLPLLARYKQKKCS